MSTAIISKQELLEHWLGHRKLTRQTIEKFPEEELFNYKVEGMRTFADMLKELLAIAVPGLQEIVDNKSGELNENFSYSTKAQLLQAWDEATPILIDLFNKISEERFAEEFNLFGQYKSPVVHSILYFIDNEIHHRGQGFVYLRLLGIQPPFFWERG
ncbi:MULTISPECIES: DinB family protein [unclassified Sphingobacterium]|uniref:DinB family protein n=1 Tax=unclassified Sphingobacterium TaxID=2609468 RepID=UPI001AE97EF6|nr:MULTISPECIES: DinB family protein [unclassified Sphingobacterium]MDR6735922.1 putative damage-inducible protein DinB [Sphingobacterium sp. 2149]